MTMNVSEEDLEWMQREWEFMLENAKTWLVKGLGSGDLWHKISNINLTEMHDALQLHLGDDDYLLLFDFALAVTATRPALLQTVADADLRS
jgi:hypothetical protein